MIKTLIVFLIIFSIIVVFHEFGHFYFARKSGILVREFSLGMGPKLFVKQGKDGVTYTVRMLPLGGYVRLAGLGEDSDSIQPGMEVSLTLDDQQQVVRINTSDKTTAEELPLRVDSLDLTYDMVIHGFPIGEEILHTYQVSPTARIIEKDGTNIQVAPEPVTYGAASVWAKLMTNFAGPMNNFILSIVVFVLYAFIAGVVPDYSATIGNVLADSPAATAGLQAKDVVKAIDNHSVTSWQDMVTLIQAHPDETLTFKVERNQAEQTIEVHTKKITDTTTKAAYGQIGITQNGKSGLLDKIMYGLSETWQTVLLVIGTLLGMFKTGFNINNFGGPVAMAQMTDAVVKSGFLTVLRYIGMISANLGAFNLLPIPALDGGKIMLNLVELVRGKPLSQEKEGIITVIGVVLLVMLMIAVTWNDISRLFS